MIIPNNPNHVPNKAKAPRPSPLICHGQEEEEALKSWCGSMAHQPILPTKEASRVRANHSQQSTRTRAHRGVRQSGTGHRPRGGWLGAIETTGKRAIKALSPWLIGFVLFCIASYLLAQFNLIDQPSDYHPSGQTLLSRGDSNGK